MILALGEIRCVAQATERGSFLSHGQHWTRIVLNPSNEESPEQNPEKCWKPSLLNGDDWPNNGTCHCDRFELVTKEDVLAGRHEFHSIHIHLGRSGFLRVGFNDFGVNVLGIDAVADRKKQ